MAWLYFLQLALLKTSLLFFYLKIFPNKIVRWLLWGTLVFNGICKLFPGKSRLILSQIPIQCTCLEGIGCLDAVHDCCAVSTIADRHSF